MHGEHPGPRVQSEQLDEVHARCRSSRVASGFESIGRRRDPASVQVDQARKRLATRSRAAVVGRARAPEVADETLGQRDVTPDDRL